MAYDKEELQDETPEEVPVEEEGESADAPFPPYSEDDPNLAKSFSEHPRGVEFLRGLGEDVVKKFDNDLKGSSEYIEKLASNWKIFSGDLPPKTFPYKDCANTHVPVALENTTRNAFRAFSELFGDWSSVVGAQSLGPPGKGEAELVALHTNWQIREQITDFKRQMHRGVIGFFFVGELACHSYYDSERQHNRHEFMTPDEFVVPYVHASVQPDYSDCPHYTKVMMLYRHALQARRDSWANVEEVLEHEPTHEDDPEQQLTKATAEVQGITPEGETAPYKILWHEGWIELPDQEKDRWCRVIVHYQSRTVLELIIQDEPSWQDVERFRAQQAELDGYRAEAANYQAIIAQQEQQVATVAQQALDVRDMMGEQQKEAVATQLSDALQMRPEPPVAPSWLDNPDDPEAKPEPPVRQPIYLFTHFVCIESLVGALGFGFGRIQSDLNRSINTMFNQFVDAATMNNVWSMIVSDQIEFDEKVSFRPGAIMKVRGMAGPDIKEQIMELRPGPPSDGLIQGVGMAFNWAASSMQAPSVLSGEPGKSGESAKLQLSRVEQATKQLSVSTRKFADSLEYVFRANAALNRVHMKDEEIIAVARARGGPIEQIPINRHLYDRGFKFSITADLRFTSKTQRIQEADEMLMLIKEFPQLQQNNAFIYQVVARCLLAREQYDLLPFLGTEIPAPAAMDIPFPGIPPAPPPQAAPPPGGAPGGNTAQQGPQQPPQAPQAPQPQGMPNR